MTTKIEITREGMGKIIPGTKDKLKIINNNGSIRTSHANASRLTAVREEIGILFGVNYTTGESVEEASVRLTNRIILSPFAAKRLAILLDDTIKSYELKYGTLGDEHRGASIPHSNALFKDISARPEITDEKAARLFELVKGLDVQIGIERSFKLFDGMILPDRFLMGFKKDDVSGDRNAKILDVCRALDMPSEYRKIFSDSLSRANIVLFGFEGDGANRLYKAYLEFGSRFKEVAPDNLDPFVIHQGFKWDTDDNKRCASTDYTCFPLFSIKGIMERVRGIYHPGLGRKPTEIAESFLKSAYEKVGCDEMLYLEAGEGDNPRRSFDLNIYRSNLRMTDLYPMFERICNHYSVPLEMFNALYEPVKNRIFGHLSGGIDRHGRDFMTIYFGVKGSSRMPVMKL